MAFKKILTQNMEKASIITTTNNIISLKRKRERLLDMSNEKDLREVMLGVEDANKTAANALKKSAEAISNAVEKWLKHKSIVAQFSVFNTPDDGKKSENIMDNLKSSFEKQIDQKIAVNKEIKFIAAKLSVLNTPDDGKKPENIMDNLKPSLVKAISKQYAYNQQLKVELTEKMAQKAKQKPEEVAEKAEQKPEQDGPRFKL